MPFSEEQRDKINRNILELSQNTTEFDQVTAILLASNIISEHERKRLINKGKNDDEYSRNFDFYNLIVKKDSRGFEILLEALEKTGQTELADTIRLPSQSNASGPPVFAEPQPKTLLEDFKVNEKMMLKITNILEKDTILAARWDLIVRKLVPSQFWHDLSKCQLLFEKITLTLDSWTSAEGNNAMFSKLVEAVKEQSRKSGDELENQSESIRKCT